MGALVNPLYGGKYTASLHPAIMPCKSLLFKINLMVEWWIIKNLSLAVWRVVTTLSVAGRGEGSCVYNYQAGTGTQPSHACSDSWKEGGREGGWLGWINLEYLVIWQSVHSSPLQQHIVPALVMKMTVDINKWSEVSPTVTALSPASLPVWHSDLSLSQSTTSPHTPDTQIII